MVEPDSSETLTGGTTMTMEKTLITNTADSNAMCFSCLNLVSIDYLCTEMVTDQ